jgi:aminopeptidase N
MKYRITLANVAHRLGFVGNTINLGSFYPVPAVFETGDWHVHEYSSNGDPFYNEIFNFDVEIETDTPFIIAHSGTSDEKTAEATREKHITANAIRDFAIVMSTDFKVLSAKSGDTAVNYFYILDKNPEASLKAAVDSVKTFSKTFCAYPYASLAVVETPFLHGGMEYGALVYISNAVSEPAEYERVIVHEIAHQWWFGIVGNDQTRTAWIDEGLAEYSCFVFYKLNPEYKSYDAKKVVENLQNNIVAYQKIVSGVNGEFDRSMSRDINEFNTPLEYVLATYSRGMLLFYNLSEIASFEKLNSGLSSFAKTNAFKFGTRENLVSSLEKSCGTKLETYFEGWVSGVAA